MMHVLLTVNALGSIVNRMLNILRVYVVNNKELFLFIKT